jgi:hypothetical protein
MAQNFCIIKIDKREVALGVPLVLFEKLSRQADTLSKEV